MNEGYEYLDEKELEEIIAYLEKEEQHAKAKLDLLEAEIAVKQLEKWDTKDSILNLQSELHGVRDALNNKKETV